MEVAAIRFTLNGTSVEADVPPDAPLLWFLRDDLGLTGTKFGCGAGMCGACTVHVDGAPSFACLTPVSMVEDADVTTIEGLSDDGAHPLQRAWVAEQVPQCGYCQSGQIMRAAALLQENPSPSRQEILDYMSPNLCRCGTYNRIVRAVARAAEEV
ncbi:MAG: (2Fe-2S)-binding protein [Pseudomonadota bacterium]